MTVHNEHKWGDDNIEGIRNKTNAETNKQKNALILYVF